MGKDQMILDLVFCGPVLTKTPNSRARIDDDMMTGRCGYFNAGGIAAVFHDAFA